MNATASNSVTVSVEVPMENLIQEITYEGIEIQKQPLTMSENLTRLAHKIDFIEKEDEKPEVDAEEEEQVDAEAKFKTSAGWPWENVRNKLRSALTELSVLSDVLAITQKKQYLILDPVSADQPESRATAMMIYKKRSLNVAGKLLLDGVERLRGALNEAKPRSLSSTPDFHFELLRLRQNWRLRKVGNSILGDLSYRTAGSRFHQQGVFEVSKAENEGEIEIDLTSSTPGPTKPASSLRVTIPNELQGIAYIQVTIQKDQDVLSLANVGLLGQGATPSSDSHWTRRLEAAQNVLFCRELFSVLAKEAVNLSSLPIPPMVVGNQITATLFPGCQLVIDLCHNNSSKPSQSSFQKNMDHNHVLEHSLHQLLREVHRQNSCVALPHPANAPIGVPKKRRLAGPTAADRHTLLQMAKKNTILEEIIKQAQHFTLRINTMNIIDKLAKDCRDPLIVAHWASLNAVTHSSVRITLLSSGYDMTARTPLVIHIKDKSLKCILKDGKSIHLSYEPRELQDLLLSQMAIHHVISLQSLSKHLGWSTLASSIHLGVGTCETYGNAAGCLLTSANGRRLIAVRSSVSQNVQEGLQVFVGYPPGASKPTSSTASDTKGPTPMETDSFNPDNFNSDTTFESTEGIVYRPLKLERLEGRNFLNKMEMLMALLGDAQ